MNKAKLMKRRWIQLNNDEKTVVPNENVFDEEQTVNGISETAEDSAVTAEAEMTDEAEQVEDVEQPENAEQPEETQQAEKPEQSADGDKTESEQSENDKTEKDQPKIEYAESPYSKKRFLQYGFDEEPEFLSIDETFNYLQTLGFDGNSLTQARERSIESAVLEQNYDPHKENCRYCDFCGMELTGVEYDIITDGRERCNECSRTVLNTLEEFKEAFLEVRSNMENMFAIKIFASIDVKTMSARKLAKKLKIKFTPTAGFDGRVLGVAINENGIYRLYVENQSPYLNAVATIAHELTHIWQYVNWDKKQIIKRYGKKAELLIYEGMAKWVEIQYLYFINEPDRAYRELCATLAREDEYGYGLRLYLDEYELSKGVNIDIKTPFFDPKEPLHDI